MLTLFEKALLMHLIGDWILQNDWSSNNKCDLKHPAGWIHAAIHFVLLSIVLGWLGGLVLAILHLVIDTRIPFNWWRKTFRMTSEEPIGTHVAIWTDQVLHILCIAAWIQFVVPCL